MKGIWELGLAIIKISLGNILAWGLSVCCTTPFWSKRCAVIAFSPLFSVGNEASCLFPVLESGQTNTWAFVLQNSSVLLLIPPKRHREIYREMFLGWCGPACACFSFLSKSKERSLTCLLLMPESTGIQQSCVPQGARGPVARPAWLIEEKPCGRPCWGPREGTTEGRGVRACPWAGSLLSCYLVKSVALLGSCSVALTLPVCVFSRAEIRAITCAQQTCVRALKVSGEGWGFLIQEYSKLGTSISWVYSWESE